jgi:hypothetical protein
VAIGAAADTDTQRGYPQAGRSGAQGEAVTESWAEEVARLRREIAERQTRLEFLVLGDQRIGVSALQAAIDQAQKR